MADRTQIVMVLTRAADAIGQAGKIVATGREYVGDSAINAALFVLTQKLLDERDALIRLIEEQVQP